MIKFQVKIILKSKRLSILENLILILIFKIKQMLEETYSINKFIANNINSEINLNYF